MGVVKHCDSASKALQEKHAQADVLRVFKLILLELPLEVTYCWVAYHQDNRKKWSNLTLDERINVIVDRLAKQALIAGAVTQEFINSLFLFEQVRVTLDGRKVTGSPCWAFDQYWGEHTA